MMTNNHQNFFELQRHYKRNSLILYFLFVMAMMIHVLVALLFCAMMWRVIVGDLTEFAWFWIVLIVPSYFILNILYQYNKLVHHDEWLLKDLPVKRLFVNMSGMIHSPKQHIISVNQPREFTPQYRRYYEFAEQLAIASNITLPKLYVMDDKGINAFVAGIDDNHMMLVVSEGALKLDNESLYGLIGHEYGHILHGDAKLNVKMYVLMSGLSWLYDVADGLEWASQWRQTPKVTRYYVKDERGYRREYVSVTGIGRLSIEFVSLLIRLIGFLGMVSSEWIKQHFNHQREFLADATSVQLTRSDGVMKLLKLLQQNPYLTNNQKHYTTHLSYFFFLNPHGDTTLNWRERISHMADTHPTNRERIGALQTGDYDEFAKMAIHHLNIDELQQVHDVMMSLTIDDVIDVVDINKGIQSKHKDDNPKNEMPISIPIYQYELELSNDKIINGRLVVDKSWKMLGKSESLIYPKQAKPDHELKGVKYVNVNHIKSLHLPLIISRFLHNNGVNAGDLTELFMLFYVVVMCHDKDVINMDDDVYFCDVFGMENHCHDVIVLDKSLLEVVAKIDRRVDNGLLLIVYQRIKQDLTHDDKCDLLIKDFQKLTHLMNINYGKNKHDDKLTILWQGVHLYGLLSLYDEHVDFVNKSLFDELMIFKQKYSLNHNEWIVIILLIKIIISHDNDHDKNIHAIYRNIRLINHTITIHQHDVEVLMIMIHQLNVIDVALLLLSYHEINEFTNQRHINTLHTALLGNGIFDEHDYEILLVLSHQWCPNHHFNLD